MVQRLLNCQEHVALGVEPAKIVFGGYQTMDRYLLPETNVANTGAKSQLDGIDKIASKERKLVVKDYIAHLVDAQASSDHHSEGLPRLLPEGKEIKGGQANHSHLGRLQDRRLGTVWLARLGSRQDKTEEASTLLARPISSGEDRRQAANSDTLGPDRPEGGESRCAHYCVDQIQDGTDEFRRPD
jgi:hypothetical protein